MTKKKKFIAVLCILLLICLFCAFAYMLLLEFVCNSSNPSLDSDESRVLVRYISSVKCVDDSSIVVDSWIERPSPLSFSDCRICITLSTHPKSITINGELRNFFTTQTSKGYFYYDTIYDSNIVVVVK